MIGFILESIVEVCTSSFFCRGSKSHPFELKLIYTSKSTCKLVIFLKKVWSRCFKLSCLFEKVAFSYFLKKKNAEDIKPHPNRHLDIPWSTEFTLNLVGINFKQNRQQKVDLTNKHVSGTLVTWGKKEREIREEASDFHREGIFSSFKKCSKFRKSI